VDESFFRARLPPRISGSDTLRDYGKLENSQVNIYCPATGYSTYPEEHPATGKDHLFNGIWLVGQPAVLALKVFQGYRNIFRSILERLDDRKFSDYGILGYMASVDCPWLSKVRKVSKLRSELRTKCRRR
jgi:hypothetical protein